jgi:hypothetical protein
MARRLPWAPTTDVTRAPPKRKPASRVPKREPSSSDSDATPKKAASPSQSKLNFEKAPKKKHGSRSPSSSPIRGPPTASPMRPGYDQDDVFMMVEDELHAVAQTFTHHLHAAEYKRLKKKAREAPPRTLPTQSATAPRDVKRKFEVMSMRDKQKAALTEDGEEKAGPSDPWLGTSLARLMGSSNQPKRTLMGSQEIQSSTRAASGFGRVESESPSKNAKTAALDTKREPELQLAPEPEIPTKVQPVVRNGQRFKASKNLRVVEGVKAPVSKADNTQCTSASEAPKTNTTVPEPKTSQARPRPAARPARKKFTFDDDFDIDAISTPEPEPGRSPAKPTARRKVKVEVKEESKKTNFSDIPTFLF